MEWLPWEPALGGRFSLDTSVQVTSRDRQWLLGISEALAKVLLLGNKVCCHGVVAMGTSVRRRIFLGYHCAKEVT